MRILFVNSHLAIRRDVSEGSGWHFRSVAAFLGRRGHAVLLPARDLPYFAQAAGAFSLWRFWRARQLDCVYIRVEGRQLRLPERFPWLLFRWFVRVFGWTVVWEINAAPDLVAFDGGHVDQARRAALDDLLRRQARTADVALCVTQGLCEFARDLGIRRVVHVENGTAPALFTPSTHASQRLEVCWMTGNSGVIWHDPDTVLRAVSLLQSETGIHFHLVGDFVLDRALPNVTLHGRVTQARLAELLQGMDVGLAIYGPGDWSRYGVFSSPLKVFDYMAAGLLVVASPIEQIDLLVRKGASVTVCPFGDAEALAQILRGIRKDDRFVQACQVNRRLTEEFYHWDRVGAMTEEAMLSR